MNKISKKVIEEFRNLKAINKSVTGNNEWKKGIITFLAPMFWTDNFDEVLPFASRQRVHGETKGCMGIMKVGGEVAWAVCHLDTGTVLKKVYNEDSSVAKAEAERYGEIFETLRDPILTLDNVQSVIKQSLVMDELREEDPKAYQMELN